MGGVSSHMHPDELVHFRKLTREVPLESLDIPALPENRRRTNLKWLFVLVLFLLVLMPFMIYTLAYSDVDRLTTGYDECGNVCGKKNYEWDGISCSGQDLTEYPYLKIIDEYERNFDTMKRKCVASCDDGYFVLFGRCIPYNLYTTPAYYDFGTYFDSVKWHIVISCLLSIPVAVGMLLLFRYATHFVVWGILLGCFLVLLIIIVIMWIGFANMPHSNRSKGGVFAVALVFTILAIILGIVLTRFRTKIRLVILLFKETSVAVFAMPRLVTVPILSALAVLLLTVLFIITSLYMDSAGYLKSEGSGFYSYQQTPAMAFTSVYNFIAFIWLCEFCVGIQYMIIASAVSQWYFARDKTVLENPIRTAASITFKYHLGTIAMGSMLITLIQLIKLVILSLINNDKVRACVNNHCLEPIERFFKFLSKNAYIVTALHGQSFLKSGRRAARLMLDNLGDIIAVNTIGEFVLGMAKVLIVLINILLSVIIFEISPSELGVSNVPAYMVIAIISFIVAYVVFGVFETGTDTIFICYCEDNLLNDGVAKPYFMTRNLMEFIQRSKEVYGKN